MDMIAALRLQIEWGADEALDDAPVDRTLPTAAPIAPASPAPRAGLAARGPVARAQQTAAAAASPEALRQALAAFTDCPLAATATNLVFADGNPDAGLVLIGDSPGAEEDLAGRPFAGPAGQFLDRMLASIGLTRADLLLTSLIPWRPPGNRPPTETEIQTCLPFLLRHVALLRPRLIVTFGTLPARALTGSTDNIRRLRGRWHSATLTDPSGPHTEIPVLPMLHPAHVQQTPASRKEAWTDLLALRTRLEGN
jgi:DNA polymerase